MNRPTVRVIALLAALTLAVSACGGGSDEASGDGSSQDTPSGSSEGTGSSGSADVEVGGDFDGSIEACGQIASAFSLVAVGPATVLLQGEESFTDVREQLAGETFTIPAELEEPFGVLEEAYAELERELEGVNLDEVLADPQAADRLDELITSYNNDEVQGAIEEIGAFLEANCTGFGPGDIGN